jgi:hypothetical protein
MSTTKPFEIDKTEVWQAYLVTMIQKSRQKSQTGMGVFCLSVRQ